MSFRRGEPYATEASRVFDGLVEPRTCEGGWSSLCPRHRGSLLYVRVVAGRLDSVRCSASAECPEVERLRGLAAQ